VEKEFPLIENIEVEFTMLGKNIQLSFLITEIRSCNSFCYRNSLFRIHVNPEFAEVVNVLWKKERWNCWKMNILPKKRKAGTYIGLYVDSEK
jgi:hypothetical protein